MTENLTFSDKIHEFYCSCSSGISATGDFSLVDPRPGSFDGCIRNVSANWIQEAGAFVLSFRIPLENYYDRCKSFFVESPFVKACRHAIRKVRTFAKNRFRRFAENAFPRGNVVCANLCHFNL